MNKFGIIQFEYLLKCISSCRNMEQIDVIKDFLHRMHNHMSLHDFNKLDHFIVFKINLIKDREIYERIAR